MKIGTKLPVSVEGIVVAEAVVTDMDFETVTFQVPGVEVVVGLRQTLTDETPEKEVEVDRVLSDEIEYTNVPPPVDEEVSFTNAGPEPKSLKEQGLDSSVLD